MRTIEGKVVVLGSQGVGKTSIIVRYIENATNHQVNPTIGASFFTWTFNSDNTTVKLQVWDTAGQERFRAMAPMYYRNANAAMLVFDLTQYSTFAAIKSWVMELRRNVENPMIFAVIGNKLDLKNEREVSSEEGRLYASKIGASYHETSVFHDTGIEDVFVTIAKRIVRYPYSLISESNLSLRLNDTVTEAAASTTERHRSRSCSFCH